MYNIYRFILPLLTLVRGETPKYWDNSSSRVFKRICFLELETFPITVLVKGHHQEVWTDQSQEKKEEVRRGE